jgi:hypothetical protein
MTFMIARNLVVLFGFTNAMKIGVACILMYGWPCSSPYVFLSIQKTARFTEKSQSAIDSGGGGGRGKRRRTWGGMRNRIAARRGAVSAARDAVVHNRFEGWICAAQSSMTSP